VSDINTAVVDSLKVLDPNRPIREADIFLTYCTNAMAAKKQNPGQQIIALPDNLSVGAAYGLTVIDGAPPTAQRYANFIVSPDGEAILVGYGFAAGTEP
jgi:molybdate transport system substrate-binding protein